MATFLTVTTTGESYYYRAYPVDVANAVTCVKILYVIPHADLQAGYHANY